MLFSEQVRHLHHRFYIGRFDTKKAAQRARDKTVIGFFGPTSGEEMLYFPAKEYDASVVGCYVARQTCHAS